MHAPQMAKFLDMNPKVLSEGRKKFMAKDIRQEISDVLNYRDDVSVDGFVEDVDAVTLLLQHVVENHLDISQNWKFEIDLGMKTVYSYPSEGTSSTDLFQFFISDLLPCSTPKSKSHTGTKARQKPNPDSLSTRR